MANLLDPGRFSWADPLAMPLHTALVEAMPTGKAAEWVVKQAGLDPGDIFFEQPVNSVWVEVIDQANVQGAMRAVVEKVLKRLGPDAAKRAFLEELLAGRQAEADPEPRAPDGTPQFREGTDAVPDPEALLYRDDLTMPIGQIGRVVDTLQRLAALASGVCKLTVTLPRVTKYGTAFRIADRWLLTNWHILHDPDDNDRRATAVSAEFGYDDDGKGGLAAAVPVRCDPAKVVTSKADDWAVIPCDPLRADWATLPLADVEPVVGGAAYIIQHPAGGRKRIGFVRNQISSVGVRVVHYLTDTREGSSGAPVFNEHAELIAVHHAGGTPQDVVGRPPVKKNEGIRVSRVRAGLAEQGWRP